MIMKNHFWLLILIFISCGQEGTNPNKSTAILSTGKWVDLTYAFSPETLYWPNNPEGFKLDTMFNGVTDLGFYYSSYAFCAPEHGGTHLDAPIHFAKGKWTADEIPLEQLTGESVVIDVSTGAENNADYQITPSDIEAWESKHGSIPENAMVFFYTGYGKYYPDAKKYFGTDEKGEAAIPNLHFPSIHPDAASWMVKNRQIKAVGIDVASVDYGQSKQFETHQILYTANIPGFENVANLDKLPAKGSFIIALPMKIKGGSGAPLRIIARIDE
jgi:kynurenine formamidase